MQKTRGTALLAASLLVMGGLSACGDEGGEASESSSTASPSAPEKESSSEASADESSTAEASESEPESDSSSGESGNDEVAELPAAAKKQTKAGAIAFNEFYQEQTGEALHTGRTEILEKYSQNCDVCDGMTERVQDYAAEGIKMNKNPNSVRSPKASKRPDGGYRVELTVVASKYHQVLSDGSTGATADAVTFTVVTDTQWTDGHWVIRSQARTQ